MVFVAGRPFRHRLQANPRQRADFLRIADFERLAVQVRFPVQIFDAFRKPVDASSAKQPPLAFAAEAELDPREVAEAAYSDIDAARAEGWQRHRQITKIAYGG